VLHELDDAALGVENVLSLSSGAEVSEGDPYPLVQVR